MPDQIVEFEIKDKIAVIRLNRPEVHNSVNDEVMSRLEEIQDILESNKHVLVVIFTAVGNESFCAGGDIKFFSTLVTRDKVLEMSLRMQVILNRFMEGNKVILAAVNGRALGGGCELLTACHYRIAAENATFSYRQAANGIITGWGGGVRLFRQIGYSHALRILVTSELIDAVQALQYGLVDQVVPFEGLMDTTFELANRIASRSSASVRAFLELSGKVRNSSLTDARKFETEEFAELWMEKDFQHWVSGFLNKNNTK